MSLSSSAHPPVPSATPLPPDVVVRADAIAHARRDLMGRITVQLRGRDEVFRASQTFAWRFRPM